MEKTIGSFKLAWFSITDSLKKAPRVSDFFGQIFTPDRGPLGGCSKLVVKVVTVGNGVNHLGLVKFQIKWTLKLLVWIIGFLFGLAKLAILSSWDNTILQ